MSQKKILYEQKSKEVEFRDKRDGTGHLGCRPHLHRELELVYMLDGEAIAVADSVRCVLHAGDIFLTFPNQIHFYETYTKEAFLLFIIKPDLIPDLMETFTMGVPQSPVINCSDRPQIAQLFLLVADAYSKEKIGGSFSGTLRRGYLLALFSEILSQMTIKYLPVGDSGALRAIVSFCAQNFAENLSLSILEEKLHLNKYYISHLFSGKLGLRFNDYVNSLRISEACRLLTNSDQSITEISEIVGFNTLRTFNRSFVKQIGISPSEYRKNEAARNKISDTY